MSWQGAQLIPTGEREREGGRGEREGGREREREGGEKREGGRERDRAIHFINLIPTNNSHVPLSVLKVRITGNSRLKMGLYTLSHHTTLISPVIYTQYVHI